LFILYNFIGKGDRDFTHRFFFICFVGAAAIVTMTANAKIIVSGNAGDTAFTDLINDLVGPDIITYQVAEAINSIGFLSFKIGKKRLKRRQVCMDI
jgi:hypothetical protein